MIAEILCMTVVSLGMPNAEYACEHMSAVVGAAEENNVKPEVLVSLIYHESRWVPTAVSKDTACGLTQVIPKYTRKFGYVGCRMLKRRPKLAIRKGGQILSYWIKNYGKGSVKVGLCAYNAGYRCRGFHADRTGLQYSKKVIAYFKNIREEMAPGCKYRD